MERNEKITHQAKEIMDNFVKALSNTDVTAEQFGVKRVKQTRTAKTKVRSDSIEFREKMFKNAPHHTDEYIVAEKKKW